MFSKSSATCNSLRICYILFCMDNGHYTFTSLQYAHHAPLSLFVLFVSISFSLSCSFYIYLFLPLLLSLYLSRSRSLTLSSLTFMYLFSCMINYKAIVSWYFLSMLNIQVLSVNQSLLKRTYNKL